ncbi:MAG: hypothetical protein WDN28_22080 [Chthoniobacter sp.]
MNTDDPKFTAHALGELDDLTAFERNEIAALLASDATATHEADETRALAARLRRELQTEESAALTETQRAAVLAAKIVPISFGGEGEEKQVAAQRPRPWRVFGPLALAASVACAGCWRGRRSFLRRSRRGLARWRRIRRLSAAKQFRMLCGRLTLPWFPARPFRQSRSPRWRRWPVIVRKSRRRLRLMRQLPWSKK